LVAGTSASSASDSIEANADGAYATAVRVAGADSDGSAAFLEDLALVVLGFSTDAGATGAATEAAGVAGVVGVAGVEVGLVLVTLLRD